MNKFISPAVQAMNLIRYIGDKVSESGTPQLINIHEIQDAIEAPSIEFALQLIEDLKEHGTIIYRVSPVLGDTTMEYNLSLDGNSMKRKNVVSSVETTDLSPCSSTTIILTPLSETL